MTNALSPEGFEDSPIVQAHDFFRLQIHEWIAAALGTQEQQERIHGLETAIFGLLELVVIDLATMDDAFKIFETLNARGTPLLASDLIKNYVLQTADGAGIDADQLYKDAWRPLESKWWRKEVAQGRIVRPRLDVFLNYWLIMRTASEVPTHDVFRLFKLHVEDAAKAIDEVALDVSQVASTYKGFEDLDPWSDDGTFFYRWRIIDAGVTTPVLMWLYSQPETTLDVAARTRCLRAIESFLVRRMLCRMTTKGYNQLFLELLGRLHAASPGLIDATFVGYLDEQTADARIWPNDRQLRNALLDLPLYRLLTRGRLRIWS